MMLKKYVQSEFQVSFTPSLSFLYAFDQVSCVKLGEWQVEVAKSDLQAIPDLVCQTITLETQWRHSPLLTR